MVICTIKSLLKKGVEVLKKAGVENPILDGELILMHVLGVGREKLVINRDDILDKDLIDKYLGLIKECALGKPLQYIIGYKEFMGLDFKVGAGVLVPRSDTEIIVEKIIDLLKGKKAPIIADICTGSGAIGISLAYYIRDSYIYALDISKKALEYCKANAIKNNVIDRLEIIEGDLLKPLYAKALEGEIDVLLSNPPYISKREMEKLPDNIRSYEPHLALYGGEDGLDYYKKIIQGASALIKKGGILIFEISYNYGEILKEIIENTGLFRDIKIEQDLAGKNRCIYCYLKE